MKLSYFVSADVYKCLRTVVRHTQEDKAWMDRYHEEAKHEDTVRGGLLDKLKKHNASQRRVR